MKSDHRYEYADGSANRYVITRDSLKYAPVTPAESSTGTYSGGEPTAVEISSEQFDAIRQAFEKAFGNKEVHIQDRIKTSGMISTGDAKVILAPGCEEKDAIERLLKRILFE